MLDQSRAPILEALEEMKRNRLVPFDVPGHKHGKGNPDLTHFLGEQCLLVDVNSMKMLDNLCHPVSVIKEAEDLAAEAFGAAHAYFMVGGTTSAVQSMVLAVCKRGDKSHTSAQCAQECDKQYDSLRCSSGVCQSGHESCAWHRTGNASLRGGEGDC